MKKYWAGAVGLGFVLMSAPVFAQEAPGRTAPTGILSDFGQELDDHGIRFRAQLIDEYANNPEGGIHQGNTNVGQVQAGLSFDLGKIFGLQGGAFHITAVRDYGSGLSHDVTGTFLKSQEIYKNQFELFRMGVFAYEQKLMDDNLDVIVGRLGTTTFYGRLTNTCYFQSGITCSVPQILNSSAGFTFPTSATWGGNVRYKPAPGIYVEAGAFEVNSFIQHTDGLDFSTSHATGVTVPFEIGVGEFDLDKKKYPGDFKVGGYVSTAPFNDPYFNTKGQSFALHGGTPLIATSLRSGVYAMGEQTVWRPDDTRALSLFGGWIQPLESEEVASVQTYAGGVLRGIVPQRPHDIISVTATYFDLTSRELEFMRDSRVKAGGPAVTNGPNEYAFEADYSALIMPSVRLSPNIQYIVNPDNSALPKTPIVPKNVLVIGLRLTLNISGLLGLPIAPNLSD